MVVTSQLSRVVLAWGSHRQRGEGTAVPAQWECVWERMVSALPLGVDDGTVHVYVNRGNGGGNTRENKIFFF